MDHAQHDTHMLLALSLIAALNTAPADSVTGTWIIKGDVVGNPINTTSEWKQAGTALSGNCIGPRGDKQVITGVVKDGTVSSQNDSQYDGNPAPAR